MSGAKHPPPWHWHKVTDPFDVNSPLRDRDGNVVLSAYVLKDANGDELVTCDDDYAAPEVESPRVRALTELAPEMLALLRELEWSGAVCGDGGPYEACPSCEGEHRRHEAGCKLAALLARIDGR